MSQDKKLFQSLKLNSREKLLKMQIERSKI